MALPLPRHFRLPFPSLPPREWRAELSCAAKGRMRLRWAEEEARAGGEITGGIKGGSLGAAGLSPGAGVAEGGLVVPEKEEAVPYELEMEVQKEAQRIMTMSVWKMYHSRMQRGGLRLHRSLQLSLVMRNARDLYLSAKLEEEDEMAANSPSQGSETPPSPTPCADPEPMETQEECRASSPAPWKSPPGPAAKPSRKRRSCSLDKLGAAEAGLVPSKKARLAEEEEEGGRQPQRQEGPFPSLARVLQDRFSGLILQGADEPRGSSSSCGQGEGVLSITVRAVVAAF